MAAPEIAFAAYPGGARDGRSIHRRRDRARRRRGAVRSARLRLGHGLARAPCRSGRSQGASRLHRGRRLRPAVARAVDGRRHRHQRQDLVLALDRAGARALRSPRSRRRHARQRLRRRAATVAQHDARCLRAARAAREVHARWRRGRGDGSVVARSRPGPRQWRRIRRRAVHEPHARSPRLPRHDGARTAQPRRGSCMARPARGGHQRRRCVRTHADRQCARASSRSASRTARMAPTSPRRRSQTVPAGLAIRVGTPHGAGAGQPVSSAAFQRAEPARRPRRAARKRAWSSSPRWTRWRTSRRRRVAWSDSVADSAPLVVVDYAHTPDALEKVLRRCARRSQRAWPAGLRVRVRRRPRSRQAGADGQRRRALADSVIVTNDNPRSEDPQRDRRRDRRRAATSPAAWAVELDRAARDRARDRRRTCGRRRAVRRQGHEDYQETHGERVPFSDRARRRAQRLPRRSGA